MSESPADNKEVRFMLRRALPICVTDPRRSRSGYARLMFDVASIEENWSTSILYRPLLLMSNAIRCGERLQELLAVSGPTPPGARLNSLDRPAPFGPIDWDKTAEQYGRGMRQVAFLDRSKRYSIEESRLLALIVVEYLDHSCHLINAFENRGVCRNNNALDQMTDILKTSRSAIQRLVQVILTDFEDLAVWVRGIVGSAIEVFGASLRRSLAADIQNQGLDFWELYLVESKVWFDFKLSDVRNVSWALEWRRTYIDLVSGFGVGARLSAAQLRDPAHLYELWCFSELAEVLRKAGRRKLLQRYTLRAKRCEPMFSDDGDLTVFYNWFGREVNLTLRPNLLPRAHVEWYIATGKAENQGVIIDTKYKTITSRDLLTVMGYTVNFGALSGVVVSRGEIDPRMVNGKSLVQGLIVSNLDSSKGTIFAALSLVPDETQVRANEEKLQTLAKALHLIDSKPA